MVRQLSIPSVGMSQSPGGAALWGHQLAGLQWMVSLYHNQVNGILADGIGGLDPFISAICFTSVTLCITCPTKISQMLCLGYLCTRPAEGIFASQNVDLYSNL